MNDFKSSQVSIDDDMIYISTTPDDIMPSYHYRFYFLNYVVFIAHCRDNLFRVLANFYPQRIPFTYNGNPVIPYHWRKFWCLNCTDNFFHAKRCFMVYCNTLICNEKDKMFSFQPVLEGM